MNGTITEAASAKECFLLIPLLSGEEVPQEFWMLPGVQKEVESFAHDRTSTVGDIT